MKSKEEKKSIVKSIKISPTQNAVITQKAKEMGMNFSAYVVNCAEHGGQGISPDMAVKLQELMNMAYEIFDSIEESDYIRREEFKQKIMDFDDILTHQIKETPQEKYNKLEKNIGLFIEGGNEIWASLK